MRFSSLEVLLLCGLLTGLATSTSAQEVKPPPTPLPATNLDAKLAGTPLVVTPGSVDKRQQASPRDDSLPMARSVPLPNGARVSLVVPQGRVSYDWRGSTLWARGDTYKAAFAPGSLTFVPFFGALAKRNYPLTLTLRETTATGSLRTAAVEQVGDVVRCRHAGITEVYRLATDRVEQTFEVASWTGDLVLTLDVTTDLRPERTAGGLRFVTDAGYVGYGTATLIDALGHRFAMQTDYADGAITLRAGADVLAGVVFPVVVDPILTRFTVDSSANYALAQPDIAYGVGDARFMVVYEFRFSAADYDVLSAAVDASGNLIAGQSAWIDTTTDSWQGPRVAYNRNGNRFLVVASVTPAAGGNAAIWSRTRASGSTTVGTAQQISGAESGNKVNPDVGGDFYVVPPTYFAVVWQRTLSSTDSDIHCRMVTDDGTPLGNVQPIDNSAATVDLRPRIAKCDGAEPSGLQAFPVVWHRDMGVQDDIWGARLRWDGAVITPPFVIDVGPDNDRYPSVSSLTEGNTRHWMVAYQTDHYGDLDIYMRVFRDGGTPVELTGNFLGTLENLPPAERVRHQLLPQVDSDGCRFAVSYLEEFSLVDWDVWVSTVHLAPGGLRATEARASLDGSSLFSGGVSLVAQHSGGGGLAYYGTVWNADATSGAALSEIRGALYAGLRPGGYSTRSTACAGMTITHDTTEPALGATMTFTVGGTVTPRFVLLSVPAPVMTLCTPQNCRIGIDPNLMVPFSTAVLQITIPCDGILLGGTLAFQGGAVGVVGGCPNFGGLAFTDTIDVTIR